MLHPDMKWVRLSVLASLLWTCDTFALQLHSSVAALYSINAAPGLARCECKLCPPAACVLPHVCVQWQTHIVWSSRSHGAADSSLCGAGPGAGASAVLHRALQEVGPRFLLERFWPSRTMRLRIGAAGRRNDRAHAGQLGTVHPGRTAN